VGGAGCNLFLKKNEQAANNRSEKDVLGKKQSLATFKSAVEEACGRTAVTAGKTSKNIRKYRNEARDDMGSQGGQELALVRSARQGSLRIDGRAQK